MKRYKMNTAKYKSKWASIVWVIPIVLMPFDLRDIAFFSLKVSYIPLFVSIYYPLDFITDWIPLGV